MDIYIRRGEEQFGPLTPEQLQESLNNGTLQADDLAWHSELPDWVSAGELLQMVVGVRLQLRQHRQRLVRWQIKGWTWQPLRVVVKKY